MKKNLRIGEILTELGYVTGEQMEQALLYQKEHRDRRLGQILVELGFVSEPQVLEALASRLELEIVDVSALEVDLSAVAMIDKDLAEKNLLLPIQVKSGVMQLVTNDPINYFALEEVRQQTGCYLKIMLSEEKPLRQAVSYYFAEAGAKEAAKQANAGFGAEELEDLDLTELGDGDEEVPIIHLLNSLVERAIKSNASDVHIEPFERETKVRMRIDGVILEYVTLQRNVHQSLIARIKIMANLDIAEKRIPQDGHFRVRTEDGYVNIRVSLMPTVYGEKAVLRVLASSVQLDHAGQFGMDDYSYQQFLPALRSSNGIIYITGPTGSGKSTTLYMILEYLSSRQVNISTIEDPVEKNMAGVNQTQVNNVAGLTFDVGLRALLRQDPDIIMVGETRDGETAGTSVRAAITGHMVLSTLHTNDAVSSIVRLADMGVETYLIANSLAALVAQRLVRKVCPNCAREMETTAEERRFLGEDVRTVWRGMGCHQCNHTGYKGRIAVHEVLTIDTNIRRMISNHATVEEITRYAVEQQGMRTLRLSTLELVKKGVTTPEEMLKIAYEW
ncbi:ATPase, T2SS/T4P/T4SS family [Roseburia hominis]